MAYAKNCYVHFHHPISSLQSLGLLSVFGALFFKSYVGLMAPPKGKNKDSKTSSPGSSKGRKLSVVSTAQDYFVAEQDGYFFSRHRKAISMKKKDIN